MGHQQRMIHYWGEKGLIPLTGPLYGVKTIKQAEMSQGTI